MIIAPIGWGREADSLSSQESVSATPLRSLKTGSALDLLGGTRKRNHAFKGSISDAILCKTTVTQYKIILIYLFQCEICVTHYRGYIDTRIMSVMKQSTNEVICLY